MYRIALEPDDNGTFLVTCPDLPEVTTWGENESDAMQRATDAIEEALAARIAHYGEIPEPSPRDPGLIASLPALTVAKVALYRAARASNITKAELGRRL